MSNVTRTAVSSSSGVITLQVGRLNLGDNYITAPGAQTPDSVRVKALTLDELFEATRIDFLKMDIQGWEADALAGGRHVLERNRGIVLLFEFWPFGLRRAGADPNRLLSYLTELGFSMYCLKRNGLICLQEISLPTQLKNFPIATSWRCEIRLDSRNSSPKERTRIGDAKIGTLWALFRDDS